MDIDQYNSSATMYIACRSQFG